MAGQSLMISTPKWDGLFGGASLIDSTTPLGPIHYDDVIKTGYYDSDSMTSYLISGERDRIGDGMWARTGTSTLNITPKAVLALVCLYVLTKLDEDRLKEAWESLDDIYKMQEASRTIAGGENNEVRFVPASNFTRIPDTPFVR